MGWPTIMQIVPALPCLALIQIASRAAHAWSQSIVTTDKRGVGHQAQGRTCRSRSG